MLTHFLATTSSRVTKNRERAKVGTNILYQIFRNKVYNHQYGIIIQIGSRGVHDRVFFKIACKVFI